MENTGRIRKPLLPVIQRMLLQPEFPSAARELEIAVSVDTAHIVMLAECGIVDSEKAARLVQAIARLKTMRFEPLRERVATRGAYLLIEDYLIETEGSAVGGILQTARSRNDWNATIQKIKLRKAWAQVLVSALRLETVLLRRALRYADMVMPAYTHGQPAMPSTFGHYLAGIAQALIRQIRTFYDAAADVHCCPLGAGAVGGTTLPIRTDRTAQLLGFESSSANSIDSVASRDPVLHLLASAAIIGVTISRLSTDLLAWCGPEFGFISLPDEVIGSSSSMPQKRNPFVLEHVQGLSASSLGAFVSAATAMHAKPFTNSIAVGTEGTSHVWRGLESAATALLLCRLVVARARPDRNAMIRRAEEGQTSAVALATRIAIEAGVDFRTAHKLVGEFILEKELSDPLTVGIDVRQFVEIWGLSVSSDGLDPASIAADSRWGGGPAKCAIQVAVDNAREECRWVSNGVRARSARWSDAEQELNEASERLCQRLLPVNQKVVTTTRSVLLESKGPLRARTMQQ